MSRVLIEIELILFRR